MRIVDNLNKKSERLAQLKSHVYDIVGCCQEVHSVLGPWLNEYVYQEALQVSFDEKQIPYEKEYYFQVSSIGIEQRQQLWNYMRLAKVPIGILYNFAPVKDQCEKYYYDDTTKTIMAF